MVATAWSVSPDGGWVAFTTATSQLGLHGFSGDHELWVMRTNAEKGRRIESDPDRSFSRVSIWLKTLVAIGILPRMAAPSVTAPQQTSRLRKYVIGFLVALVVVYVTLCLFIYFQQDQMQFPTLTEYEKVTPLNIGIAFEDLRIPVHGSEQIHAWWIPASPPSNKALLRVEFLCSVVTKIWIGEDSAGHFAIRISPLQRSEHGYTA